MSSQNLSVTLSRYVCQYCLTEFESKRSATYCSSACKQAAWRRKNQPKAQKTEDAALERLVDDTLERCNQSQVDPKQLLLYLKLHELKEFLSHFDRNSQKRFVMDLVDSVLVEGRE